MSCYHPLKAFPVGQTVNGKTKYKVCSYDVDHVEKINTNWIAVNRGFVSALASEVVTQFVEIPCGQCIGCRFDYSRQWANRCMMELQYHESSYFVTLTYDDAHVHKHWYSDPATGEAFQSLSLCKKDFQDFMKRLRKQSGQKVRYFAAGEYGSQTARPHYHAIIFGLKLDDLQVYKRSPQGFVYYLSPFMESVWQHGYVVVADVSWETCAYTARYIVKKLKGEESVFYDVHNIEPEFSLMSRKPGLARQFFDDHPNLYEEDFIHISTEKKGLKFRPPRYFDQLFDIDHPVEMEQMKFDRQQFMNDLKKFKLERSSKSYLEMLADEESAFINRTKSLERSLS